jgi:hypothetical protein
MAAARQQPRSVWVGLAAVAVAALAVGVIVTRLHGGGDGQSADAVRGALSTVERPALPEGVAGPAVERAGLDVGFSRDESGAVAAAVEYATAPQRWLYFSDDEIRVAVAEIATPMAAPRMADEIVLDVSTAREQLDASPGRVWWLVRPLAWRVDRFVADEARVSVWVVTILSAAEVAAPQAEYGTVTIDLAWVDGNWRVDAVRDTPGPTPMTGPHDQPWDAVPFDEALDGFTRMDGEPVR